MAYADYYERALTNGILSIQRGTEPGVYIYFFPLHRGASKAISHWGWGKPFDAFWCCYGTGHCLAWLPFLFPLIFICFLFLYQYQCAITFQFLKFLSANYWYTNDCAATETFSKLGDSIYFEEEGRTTPTLYIIQFISSFLEWKSANTELHQIIHPVSSWGLKLRVEILFPKEVLRYHKFVDIR